MAPGLWSRPTPRCEIGMRPNSPCHTTSVSIQQAAAFRSGQQAGDRLVHFRRVLCVVLLHDAVVRVPGVGVLIARAAVIELHETDAALHQAPGHQALAAEWLGGFIVEP